MAFAQPDYFKKRFEHEKDSLVKELNKHPLPDTARAVALMNVFESAVFLSERKEVLPYWAEAVQLSRKLNFRKVMATCLVWKGSFYKSERRTDSALLCLDSAIALAGDLSDTSLRYAKGFALFQKGMIYENQENLYTALNAYFGSLKSYDTTDIVKQKMTCLRIASIYTELHNDTTALEYYQRALTLYERQNGKNSTNEAEGINIFIAGIYYDRNELAKASYYLNKMRPFMPDTVQTTVSGGYYHLAGKIALRENKTDSAIYLLTEALKYFNKTRQMHMDDIANVCSDITALKMEKHEMGEAKKYAELAMLAARESRHKETMANALVVMAEYDNKTGDQPAAYQALHLATVLNDSVLTETNIKQANTLAAIYENDKKEKAITQLEIDKKTESADVRQKALLNTIFLITILGLLLLGTISYLYFKNRRQIQQQRIAELEKEKQLMGIEAMLKGQEEERSRLARDLHDGLSGMLSGVKISFSNMRENLVMDSANATVFERSLGRLDNTISELRKVAHNLMPEALVRFGLKSAVQDFCESMQLSGNTKIICEQFGSDRKTGSIADINIYRIIQELVNNALVHGKAAQILVQLTKTADKVLITVEDDGRGFDLHPLQRSPGIGLTNIRSRVNYFNGKMDIESKKGEGTIINIELMV
ncbi:MAG TPA: sensor histidine kinase [Puia sp.]|nr:sensor histidine kinase [Puia sp.]